MNLILRIITEKYEKSSKNKNLVRKIRQIMYNGKNPDQVCTRQTKQAKKTARKK